jgi:hypothetical protein
MEATSCDWTQFNGEIQEQVNTATILRKGTVSKKCMMGGEGGKRLGLLTKIYKTFQPAMLYAIT